MSLFARLVADKIRLQSIGGLYRCRNRHQAFCRCRFNECKVRDRRNQLVTVSQTTNVHDLRAYNEARDQYGRWLVLSDFTLLKTKEQWTFGFMHLFQFCGAAATLKYGSQRGGLELITNSKSAATQREQHAARQQAAEQQEKAAAAQQAKKRQHSEQRSEQESSKRQRSKRPGLDYWQYFRP